MKKIIVGTIFLGTSISAQAALIFSEIMYNPASVSDTAWEWIEVYNDGGSAINLSGYVLDDFGGSALGSANITSGSIAAGGIGVLYNSSNTPTALKNAWGNLNFIAVSSWSGLNNGGDQIGLWDSLSSYDSKNFSNATINITYDDGGASWPTDDSVASIFLNDLSADATNGSNWTLSQNGILNAYTSNPAGTNNATNIGSPGLAPVPIPAALPLFSSALVGLGFMNRRRKKN